MTYIWEFKTPQQLFKLGLKASQILLLIPLFDLSKTNDRLIYLSYGTYKPILTRQQFDKAVTELIGKGMIEYHDDGCKSIRLTRTFLQTLDLETFIKVPREILFSKLFRAEYKPMIFYVNHFTSIGKITLIWETIIDLFYEKLKITKKKNQQIKRIRESDAGRYIRFNGTKLLFREDTFMEDTKKYLEKEVKKISRTMEIGGAA